MAKGEARGERSWVIIADGILYVGVLALCIEMARQVLAVPEGEVAQATLLFPVTLLVVALAEAIRLFFGGGDKLSKVKNAVFIAATAGGAALVLVQGYSALSSTIAANMYLLALVAGRVIAIIRKPKRRNVILNALSILALLLLLGSRFFLAALMMMGQALLHIVPVAFARIRLEVLKKIIRKTYAAEILFGIVLLIVAFSLFLPTIEDSIETFEDGLWYCFAIVTTIGFGDITATTRLGRVMSIILGLYGIIVVSLITSIIVNFYGEMKREDDEDEIEDGGEKLAAPVEHTEAKDEGRDAP